MRLAAHVKGGFYPAHEEAVAFAATFLQAPVDAKFAILDPCAGQGTAIRKLGELLGCSPALIHAIELDDHRADEIHALLPESQVLAPADFFGCRGGFNIFSFVWLNPPFDFSFGGHRVEEQFLGRATEWLVSGGVMALVCPEDVVGDFTTARKHFVRFYENITVVPFPKEHRPFNEVIVFGQKRTRPEADQFQNRNAWEFSQAPPGYRYQIPTSNGPRLFQKIQPTEAELERMLRGSSLRSHLTSPAVAPVPSPPLPLGIGHVALLLASGHLDGVVHPKGKLSHVVRGTSRKHSFVSDVTDAENQDGSTTTRTTISERIELVIRTVDRTGRIQTFTETDAKDE